MAYFRLHCETIPSWLSQRILQAATSFDDVRYPLPFSRSRDEGGLASHRAISRRTFRQAGRATFESTVNSKTTTSPWPRNLIPAPITVSRIFFHSPPIVRDVADTFPRPSSADRDAEGYPRALPRLRARG